MLRTQKSTDVRCAAPSCSHGRVTARRHEGQRMEAVEPFRSPVAWVRPCALPHPQRARAMKRILALATLLTVLLPPVATRLSGFVGRECAVG